MAYRYEIKIRSRELHRDRSASEVNKVLGKEFGEEPDVRTICRWSKQPEAFPPLSSNKGPSKGDKVTISNRGMKEHVHLLSRIATSLVRNDLSDVRENSSLPDFAKNKYTLWPRHGNKRDMDRKELASLLIANLDQTLSKYGKYKVKLLSLHLKAEVNNRFPQIEYTKYPEFFNEYPYEAIDLLRILELSKSPRGTCPVCEACQ